MITSKQILKEYLEADKTALNIHAKRTPLFGKQVWKFEIALRHYEYYYNVRSKSMIKEFMHIIPRMFWRYRYNRLSLVLGFHVPLNVCGKGLNIWHHGCVVISDRAKIGDFCCIQQCVNIGRNHESDSAPIIGDYVYIGPGAKIFGKLYIADGCAIGAGAVVTKSFETPNMSIVGIPAHENGVRRPGLTVAEK